MSKGKLVAKLKFWFGMDEPIFDKAKYVVELDKESFFVYIYERVFCVECEVLQKTLATNWSYFTCVKCGRQYFSSGNAKVIDFSEEDKKRLEVLKSEHG